MKFNEHNKYRRDYIGFFGWCICIFLSQLFLFSSSIFAAPVGEQQARKTVRGWLKTDARPFGVSSGLQIKSTDIFYDEAGEAIYYVIYLQSDGFVIAPADDRVEPIICFARGKTFKSSDDSPLYALVSRDVPARIAAVRELDTVSSGLHTEALTGSKVARRKAAVRARDRWSRLSGYDDMGDLSVGALGLSGVSDVRVSPFLQSTWGQTTVGGYSGGISCYNYYTPPYETPDGDPDNYPCGCVATAMAQLMRYHEYPGAYIWSNMPLQPDSSITLIQRQAIGALCYAAAESVDMDYGPDGSSASLYDANRELKDTFYYSNSIYGYYPSIGTALNNMANPNLDAELPVLLGISGPYGGHAVVCDGYGYSSSVLYHHINMGWDGREDAWYNLPDVDSSPYYFNSVHGCVYNVFTSGSGEIISGRVTDMADNPIPGATVTASGGGTYYATTNDAGIYAMVGLPSNRAFTVSASASPCTFVNQYISTGKSSDGSGTSGNKWAIDFASQNESPPIAYNQSVAALSGSTEIITLNAADEGLPDPPGQLSYIIATLPEHGTLTDPADDEITDVPYTLAGNSNVVEYRACAYFVGQDSFDFKANDGGTPPLAGDSEAATVTIDASSVVYVEPLVGDFEPDCDVDFDDFAILGNAWQTSSGEGNYNPDCDISETSDGIINESDLAEFAESWLESIP